MATIYVLFTVMMGTQMPITVHDSLAECDQAIQMQKMAGIMDTSSMKCVKYVKSK